MADFVALRGKYRSSALAEMDERAVLDLEAVHNCLADTESLESLSAAVEMLVEHKVYAGSELFELPNLPCVWNGC